jgi:hypothetical protein
MAKLGYPLSTAAEESASGSVYYRSQVSVESVEGQIRCNIDSLLKEQIPETWIRERKAYELPPYSSGRESEESVFKPKEFSSFPGDGTWETLPETNIFEYQGLQYTEYGWFLQVELGMFALVDKTWTKELAKKLSELGITRCLEVCAGRGWLSKALMEHGIAVISTDINPERPVIDVEKIGANHAIRKYKKGVDALIISWPFPGPAKTAIKAWVMGKPVIYIGEGPLGCTADINFFKRFKVEQSLETPRWEHNNSVCMIGRKVEHSDDYDYDGRPKKALVWHPIHKKRALERENYLNLQSVNDS